MAEYLYVIAGLKLKFETPFEVHIGKESTAFLRSQHSEAPDWTFSLEPCSSLLPLSTNAHRECCTYYDGDRVWYAQTSSAVPYAMTRSLERGKKTVCRYRSGSETYLNYSRNLCELMGFEKLLLHFDGLMLHASLIRYRGEGIAFSAPSGEGKSTQADLWQRYCGAEILNGDRAGLRKTSARWTSYGLPFAGSSGIYRNESAPLRAIVVLRQAQGNFIRRLSEKEAFSMLLPEWNLRRWDTDSMERAVTLSEELIKTIPVYMLQCLPNEEAVKLLRDTLFQEGNV